MARTTDKHGVMLASVSALAMLLMSSMAFAEGDQASGGPDVAIDPIETVGVVVDGDNGPDVSIDPMETSGEVIAVEDGTGAGVDPELGDPGDGQSFGTEVSIDPVEMEGTPVEEAPLADPSVISQSGVVERQVTAHSNSSFESNAEREAAQRSVPNACDTAGPGLAWLCGKTTH